jgi:hypothetical protein
MGASGLLDFFTLEAADYLERLDAVVSASATAPLNTVEFLTEARALRGAAMMARQEPIAGVAVGLERLAKGLREGGIAWSPAVRGTAVSTIDDLKILVRNVRSWTPDDDARATRRREELARVAPQRAAATPMGTAAPAVRAFIASELDLCAQALRGDSIEAWTACTPRVRALRGMAALQELSPVGDVIAVLDDRLARLEESPHAGGEAARPLLSAVARVLTEAAAAMHRGERPPTRSDALQEFADVSDAAVTVEADEVAVVPIESLFFGDEGPHLIVNAPQPPVSRGARFRAEVVAPAEHLRRVVADAARGADGPAHAVAVGALRRALGTLSALATSFSETAAARAIQAVSAGAHALSPEVLQTADRIGLALSDATDTAPLAERLQAILRGDPIPIEALAPTATAAAALRDTPAPETRAWMPEPIATPAPSPVPTLTPARRSMPVKVQPADEPAGTHGAALHDLLDRGIAGLGGLDATPLSPPVILEEELVSIDDLLYRGQAALERAIALREHFRRETAPPSPDAVEELFALLELARTE